MKNRGNPKHKGKDAEHNPDVSDTEFSELIKKQYDELRDSLILDVEDRTKSLLIPQTILGRAQNGHGLFNGACRPNITQTEVYEALGMNPEKMRNRRQAMQNNFKNCIDDLFDGKKDRLMDRSGHPIYGVRFLEGIKLVPDKDFWRGVLVARMDMSEWRKQTLSVHPKDMMGKKLKIGYGKEHPVSVSQLLRVTGRKSIVGLAETPHTLREIQRYRREGLIVRGSRVGGQGVENLFIRYAPGKGVCDDAAMISVGLLHGEGAMVLGFAIDATDTYTKFGKMTKEWGLMNIWETTFLQNGKRDGEKTF
jgi:hypothetical protein